MKRPLQLTMVATSPLKFRAGGGGEVLFFSATLYLDSQVLPTLKGRG